MLSTLPSFPANANPAGGESLTAAAKAAKDGTLVVDKELESAQVEAVKTGKRVPAPSQYTESMKVWANPDGKTLHAEVSTGPVQLQVAGKDGTKTWQPIDTTIVKKGDNTYTAKLVKTPLTIGGEGSQKLVIAQGANGTSSIGWGNKLPKPTLDGNKIVYRDAVALGADLVLTALPDGFTQDVVLRRRPKRPLTVKLPVTLPKGMSYAAGAGSASPKLMSAQGVVASTPLSAQAVDAVAAESPEAGKTANVTVATETTKNSTSLVIKPDTAFLSSADVTYPVTISVPSQYVGAGLTGDTFVSKNNPTTNYSNGYLRAGTTSTSADIARVYLRFAVTHTVLAGATIHNADFMVINYRSGGAGTYYTNCGEIGSGIVTRKLTSAFTPNTLTWNSGLPSYTTTGQVGVKYGYSDTAGCTGPGELVYSIESIVQAWADGEPDYGLVMMAPSESAVLNWRQYRSQETGTHDRGPSHEPVLFVEYTPAPHAQVVFSSFKRQSPNLTYDQAVALADYQAATTETDPVSEEDASLLEAGRGANDAYDAYPVTTDMLDITDDDTATEGADGADTIAPSVVAIAPSSGAGDVPLDTLVSASFSEPVTDAMLDLKSPDGALITGSLAEDNTGTAVTFTPSQPLTPATTYTVTVSGAHDAWDNVMEDFTSTFTTAGGEPTPSPSPSSDPDTTAPTVVATLPTADATDVAVDAVVSATFSEPVTAQVIVLKDNVGTAIDGATAMDATSRVLSFTPSTPLSAGVTYTALISDAKDTAGNVMSPYSWTFTTAAAPEASQSPTPEPSTSPSATPPADTTAPVIIEVSPQANATGVTTHSTLTATFSEPVTGADVTLTPTAGGSAVTGTVNMDATSTVATFTPSQALSSGVTYTATISAAKDTAGNTMSAYSWSFTTIAASPSPSPTPTPSPSPTPTQDVTPPTITTTNPASGASAPFGADIVGVFSEPVRNAKISVSNGTKILTGTMSMDTARRVLTWKWDGDSFWPFGAMTATISGAKDDAGNVMSAYSWSFIWNFGTAAAQKDGNAKAGPTSTSAKADTEVKTAYTGFDYQHITLEDCVAAHDATAMKPDDGYGHRASIITRPYSMCWSSWYYVKDYVWYAKLGQWVGTIREYADVDTLEFRATWVMHTYLGTATGTSVIGGGYTPQQISMWTRISNMTAYRDGVATTANDYVPLSLQVIPTGSAGSTCTALTASYRSDTIQGWKADGDDYFKFRMGDTDGDRVDVCTLRPVLTDTNKWWTAKPIRLWSQVVYDQGGSLHGKRAVGGGDPSGNDPQEKPYVPHVRCDWMTFGQQETVQSAKIVAAGIDNPTGYTGACVISLAKDVFTMSKSRNANFIQVINHIEAALDQDNYPAMVNRAGNNSTTYPPKRNNESQNPPLRALTGNEKIKIIPGDWSAPAGTPASEPLTRTTDPAKKRANREVHGAGLYDFEFWAEGKKYTKSNYCKYYQEPLYSDWNQRRQLDPKASLHCDEYPFGSTIEGAANTTYDYSLRALGGAQNTAQGNALSAFYSTYRIGDGNHFWVQIVP